jgi:hypothetical protein
MSEAKRQIKVTMPESLQEILEDLDLMEQRTRSYPIRNALEIVLEPLCQGKVDRIHQVQEALFRAFKVNEESFHEMRRARYSTRWQAKRARTRLRLVSSAGR